MSDNQDLWVFDDLPEPGVLSGVMTLLGGLLGLFLVGYSYFYGPVDGPVASAHIGWVVGFGLLFVFLLAAFTFLIGWAIELSWPVLLLMMLVGALLLVPLYLYFGADGLISEVSRAILF